MENLTRKSIIKAIQIIDKNQDLVKGRESFKYDLIYKGKKYPPILVISEANKILGGSEIFLSDFGNSVQKAFKILSQFDFIIMEKEGFYNQLLKFLEQTKTTDMRYAHYQNNFLGLKVRVSFGKGNIARIPWISFLGENQTTENGIYPGYLYYKEFDELILAYCVSETNPALLKWIFPNDTLRIKDYYKRQGRIPVRYGSSYIFKTYNINSLPSKEEIENDLKKIIAEYKLILNNNGNIVQTSPIIEKPKLNIPKRPVIDFDLEKFQDVCKSSGLLFSNKLITRFTSSLITKPFVILSGLSGSGKTKLAQSFSKWICGDKDQYEIIPVGADWTNREPLLGYPNALEVEKYVTPENSVVDLILHAHENKHLPYFLILDEMNLSHVERYFADFLSVMESNGEINFHSGTELKSGVPATVLMPDNLFIIGTINVDETTYMFSPKVLDRANVIEFRITENEIAEFLKKPLKPDLDKLKGAGAGMAESFMEMARATEFENPANGELNESLVKFFGELKKTGAEFGYRSAYEIHRLINQLTKIDDEMLDDEKLDIAIMQKLLPKLHGSRNKLTKILPVLGGFCLVKNEKIKETYFEKFDSIDFDKDENIKFRLAFEKICRMYKNAVENGYSSYAEA